MFDFCNTLYNKKKLTINEFCLTIHFLSKNDSILENLRKLFNKYKSNSILLKLLKKYLNEIDFKL